MMESRYIKVPTPPTLDIISDIKFSPVENQLLVTSWDSQILLYDIAHIETSKLVAKFQSSTPALCITYGSNNSTYVGTLEGGICGIDYENDKLINQHWVDHDDIDCGINNINTMDNLIISTSFNNKFQGNDPRQSSSSPAFHNVLTDKIFTMDTNDQYVILSLAHRKIAIYDKRDWHTPLEIRESPFDLQINDLKCFPDHQGFAVSSIDGRVGMEFFPSLHADNQRFAFRCHRITDKLTNTQIAYPVNALVFNDNYLYTGGSDGIVNVWHWKNKKKNSSLSQLTYNNTQIQSICNLDINYNKSMLAIATSDDGYKSALDLDYTSSLPEYPSNIYLYQI